MRLFLTFAVLLQFSSFLRSQDNSPELLGCSDLSLLSKSLAQLEQSDWKDISPMTIKAQWPTTLYPLDCNGNTCTSVWDKGRIIKGHCECCSIFHFLEKTSNDNYGGPLINIIITHSFNSRPEALVAARTLALAVGLPNDRIALIGNKPNQRFNWDINQRISLLEVSLIQNGRLWEINFNYSRQAL